MDACLDIFDFGPFRLEPDRRLLLANGSPVALTSRAYDVLEFLVRNRDRVVTREEIIAHVWNGVTVGENNLSVQVSTLRQVLSVYVDPTILIINMPGRGYRFIGKIASEVRPSSAVDDETSAGSSASSSPRPWSVYARRSIIFVPVCALIWFLVPILYQPATAVDARLSVSIEPFDADTNNPVAVDLARCYYNTVVSRFKIYNDIVLIPQSDHPQLRFTPHFRLHGSVHLEKAHAAIVVDLTESSTGVERAEGSAYTKIDAKPSERDAVGTDLLMQIRPELFESEHLRRKTAPRDAVDFYIDSQVATHPLDTAVQVQTALSLAERATAADPRYLPGTVLLSYLLTYSMLRSDASKGDEQGLRALSLINQALFLHPNDTAYLDDRALTLAVLGRLDEAHATVERGLRIEPDNYRLKQLKGEILMQQGHLAEARELICEITQDPTDDRLAYLAFAERDYRGSVEVARRVIAASPYAWDSGFTMLIEAASLYELGEPTQANDVLDSARKLLPAEFQIISGQRQNFYALPDEAWSRFKTSLSLIGMKS